MQYAMAIQGQQCKPKVYALNPWGFVTYTNTFMHVYCSRFPCSGFYVHNKYWIPRYGYLIIALIAIFLLHEYSSV